MIGYTCGYLRYYYPKEFITAYLNNANNEDDINMGTELANQFNIPIHNIKFGHSTAKYSCDKNGIYKGLASIKFLSDEMAQELYELGKNNYDSFIDLLVDIHKTTVDSRQLDILVKLQFFSTFDQPNTLLEQIKVFNAIYGKKTAKRKDDGRVYVGDYSLSLEEFEAAFADSEDFKMSAKQAKGFDSVKLIKIICSKLTYPPTTIMDKINYEQELLGYISLSDKNADKKQYYITKLTVKQKIIYAEVYHIKSGKTHEIRQWRRDYEANPYDVGDILYICSIDKKNKRKPKKDENGNTKWIEVEDEFDYFMNSYYVDRKDTDA